LLGRDESGDRSPRKLASDIWNVVADLDGFAEQTAQEIKEGATVLQMLEVEVYGQQAPNPDSRVTLDDERDALGMPRVRMHWSLTDFDRRSVDRTLRIVAQEFGRLGLGRMHLDFKEWEPDFYYGNHHMGTTRMHDDPRKGVVDRNCRVHGVGNLYVAGSSTFPTSGNAPPTMTIVAMALRLADTIKAELSA
jgi:choline dehydrogenase-like flavoprotein